MTMITMTVMVPITTSMMMTIYSLKRNSDLRKIACVLNFGIIIWYTIQCEHHIRFYPSYYFFQCLLVYIRVHCTYCLCFFVNRVLLSTQRYLLVTTKLQQEYSLQCFSEFEQMSCVFATTSC